MSLIYLIHWFLFFLYQRVCGNVEIDCIRNLPPPNFYTLFFFLLRVLFISFVQHSICWSIPGLLEWQQVKEKHTWKLCRALKAIQDHVSMGTEPAGFWQAVLWFCFLVLKSWCKQVWMHDTLWHVQHHCLIYPLHLLSYTKLTFPPWMILQWLCQLNEHERWYWTAGKMFLGFTIYSV